MSTLKTVAQAFLGYGHNEKTGEFFIKLCPRCEGYKDAKKESAPLRTVDVLCSPHVYAQINELTGDKQDRERARPLFDVTKIKTK